MKKSLTLSIVMITVGTFIFAVGINMFSIANNLGEGGVTGLSLLAYYIFDLPVSLTSFVVNIIILVIGYRYLEKKTMNLTILATILTSVFLELTSLWQFKMENAILAPICSGFLVGLSLGIVIQAGGTTAGSDILALIINKYIGWSTSVSLLILDTIVVIPFIFIIGLEKTVLTIIHLYITTKVLDFILEGFNPKKSVTIVSDHHEKIAESIDKKLGRGMTFLDGEGYYGKDKKKVIMVVVNRQQIMPLTRIVQEIDPKAFLTITEVQNVIGEGFSYILSDEENQEKINEFVSQDK